MFYNVLEVHHCTVKQNDTKALEILYWNLTSLTKNMIAFPLIAVFLFEKTTRCDFSCTVMTKTEERCDGDILVAVTDMEQTNPANF